MALGGRLPRALRALAMTEPSRTWYLSHMRVLISGGAGFVGSHLARAFRGKWPKGEVVVLDNLRRRGSEMNLPLFKQAGIRFAHGDVRNRSDLFELEGNFDCFVDASAEPSVLAGLKGDPDYVIETNLGGTLNALAFARARAGTFVFLSTSRVYSMEPLRRLSLKETPTRFECAPDQKVEGLRGGALTESFSTATARSLYGASKLASEMFVQEYAGTYGMKAVINRCGVLCGPGQFGKTDQGVFSLWVFNHLFNQPLKYLGYGGKGKQVRDLLHPADLFDLVEKQIAALKAPSAKIYNAAGGIPGSVSLAEFTALCREATGREVPIESQAETHGADVPYLVLDSSAAAKDFGWQPKRSPKDIATEIAAWAKSKEPELRGLLGLA
jgi:CDP-paratose 2-epimerase